MEAKRDMVQDLHNSIQATSALAEQIHVYTH